MNMITVPHCAESCLPCADCCDCTPADARVGRLQRWAWGLTALTIGWNCLEAAVAVIAGYQAGSVALLGFGLDSVVEVSSALVVLWWLSRQQHGIHADEATERRAVRLIALTFFAMAAYVAVEAASKLLGLDPAPQPSNVGLALVALSLLVMPTLAGAKRRVAQGLGSVALHADAAETQLCFYLSGVVLLGLIANQLWSWWWADAIAGLCVAGLAFREGRAAWTTGDLCAAELPGARVLAPVHCLAACCPACPVPA
jgi:divalent metal cation (Fe/Co/Zn/Cd) transporter